MCSITQRLKCSIKHALTLTSIHALKLALELNALTQVCSSLPSVNSENLIAESEHC